MINSSITHEQNRIAPERNLNNISTQWARKIYHFSNQDVGIINNIARKVIAIFALFACSISLIGIPVVISYFRDDHRTSRNRSVATLIVNGQWDDKARSFHAIDKN